MIIPTEFTGRKLQRKLATDGAVETARAAGDLLTRKRLGRSIFDPLVKHDFVHTLSRKELLRRTKAVEVPDSESSIPFASIMSDGVVLTETGLALTKTFEIVEESAAGPDQAQQAMMAMLSRELFYGTFPLRGLLFGADNAEIRNLDSAPVAPLIPRYPDNYYHWMVETVPKIRYLRAFDAEQEPVTVLVPADAPPFVDETLDLLNWPDSRIKHAGHESYRVSDLVVPSFPDRQPADFRWLRQEILESAPNQIPESSTNVYVSRGDAVERRVVNEAEVMDALSEFDFERYLLENRSLAENARLFADADIIVGPHGAGLTDIIFAGDGTLIELFGEKVKQPYRLLADAVDIDYEAMYCTPESTDIVVDVEELSERVEEALQDD